MKKEKDRALVCERSEREQESFFFARRHFYQGMSILHILDTHTILFSLYLFFFHAVCIFCFVLFIPFFPFSYFYLFLVTLTKKKDMEMK